MLGVLLECRLRDLEKSSGDSSDSLSVYVLASVEGIKMTETYVVVWATLAGRENGVIDALLQIFRVLKVLAEEDQPSPRATKRLVGGRSNNVTELKGVVKFLRRDQPTRMCDIGHQPRAFALRDFFERTVVPVPWVCGRAADDQAWLKDLGLGVEASVVDEPGAGDSGVGEGLEVDGRGGHLFLGSVIAMGEMATIGEAKTHKAVLRL